MNDRYKYKANKEDIWREISISIRNESCILLTGLGLKAIVEQNQKDLIYISRLIVQIPFRAYFTTSYDTSIEDQYEAIKGSTLAMAQYDKASTNKVIENHHQHKPYILKLHDNRNDPNTINDRIPDIPYPRELRKIFLDLSILLLGFTKTDPELEDLKELFCTKVNVKHWILIPEGRLSPLDMEQLWKNARIATIEYTTISDLRNFFIKVEKLSTVTSTIKVFISYVSVPKDIKLKEELMTHMKGGIEFQNLEIDWDEGDIGAGKEKKPAILESLRNTEIILLLLSSDYLFALKNNHTIELEMRNAVQKHHSGEARVIPVILRECIWEDKPFLADLQTLPQKNGQPIKPIGGWPSSKRDDIYKEVALDLKKAIADWLGIQ